MLPTFSRSAAVQDDRNAVLQGLLHRVLLVLERLDRFPPRINGDRFIDGARVHGLRQLARQRPPAAAALGARPLSRSPATRTLAGAAAMRAGVDDRVRDQLVDRPPAAVATRAPPRSAAGGALRIPVLALRTDIHQRLLEFPAVRNPVPHALVVQIVLRNGQQSRAGRAEQALRLARVFRSHPHLEQRRHGRRRDGRVLDFQHDIRVFGPEISSGQNERQHERQQWFSGIHGMSLSFGKTEPPDGKRPVRRLR